MKTTIENVERQASQLISPAEGTPVVQYDPVNNTIRATFNTPTDYQENPSNFYQRWHDNATMVAFYFKKANLPVDEVIVTTNFADKSAILRLLTTKALKDLPIHEFVTGSSWLIKVSGSDTWEELGGM